MSRLIGCDHWSRRRALRQVRTSLPFQLFGSVSANTLAELVALAKAQPGKLYIGSGIGSPPDLVARLLARAAGIELAFIPFKTGPEGLVGVMRGDVSLFIDAPPMIVVLTNSLTVFFQPSRVIEAEIEQSRSYARSRVGAQ